MNIKEVEKILKVTENIVNKDPELKLEHSRIKLATEMLKNNLLIKASLLRMAKEIREVTDIEEAARLVQSDNWVIVHAAKKESGIMWALVMLGNEE